MADSAPIRIDLADYDYAGEGANGSSYNSKSDPGVMLKLNNVGKETYAARELEVARKVYALGIPTPEPGDLVTDGERIGVRFRRIAGKKSFSRAVGDDPARVADYATQFAQMCRELHSVHVGTSSGFPSVKDQHLQLLADNPFFSADEKEKIAAFIRRAPDTDTAIHGDLQYSNVIFAGDEKYFIDLGDFAYGYPLFDIGMVYLCCNLSKPDFIREVYHMEKSTAQAFWKAFAPVYFGPGADLEAREREVRLYAGLKTLLVERDTRCPMPEFRVELEPILK